MTTNMETECLCLAVKEMAETVLKMAEISQMDEEWRKETASAIGLTAELAMRMLAAGDAEERTRSEALFWTSFLAGGRRAERIRMAASHRKATSAGHHARSADSPSLWQKKEHEDV